MIKIKNIIKEENEGKTIALTNTDRKILNILQKQKVDYTRISDIITFLVSTLAIDDEELISRFVRLYHYNWAPGMFECDSIREDECVEDFSKMKKGVIDLEEKEYTPQIIALSRSLNINPIFIIEDHGGDMVAGGDTYLPEYSVVGYIERRGRLQMINNEGYSVAQGWDQAYDAAYTRVKERWEDEGINWFSEEFVENYVEISQSWVESESIRITDEELSNTDSEEDMREMAGVSDEYDSYNDELEMVKSEIVDILNEIQEEEFKRDNIEKEKIILEKEIERLGYDIDYGTIDPNYGEFSYDIERLQNELNRMEGLLEEIKTIIKMLHEEHGNHQIDIEDYKKELSKYEGENLEKIFIRERELYWQNDINDDPLEYIINERDFSLSEAIGYGYAEVDEERLLGAALDSDGISHFLADYDGVENLKIIDGEEYYIFRTN